MKKVIDSQTLLVICAEGDSSNLTEEKYLKQLHKYIKINKPKWIKFSEIQVVKAKVNEILKPNKIIKKLESRGTKAKFNYIAIWKDNDDQEIIQKQNDQIYNLENKLFNLLKKFLREGKQVKENFGIWILPKGWNFETFYRKHFVEQLKISDRDLKEIFKKPDYFLKKLFSEDKFKIIMSNLKKESSPIGLFDFGNEENEN